MPSEYMRITDRLGVWCRAAGSGSHVGPFGLLALRDGVDIPALRRMLAVAREFAEEWSELRGLHQQKLAGQLLR